MCASKAVASQIWHGLGLCEPECQCRIFSSRRFSHSQHSYCTYMSNKIHKQNPCCCFIVGTKGPESGDRGREMEEPPQVYSHKLRIVSSVIKTLPQLIEAKVCFYSFM